MRSELPVATDMVANALSMLGRAFAAWGRFAQRVGFGGVLAVVFALVFVVAAFISRYYTTSALLALLVCGCVIVPRLNKANQRERAQRAEEATRDRIRAIVAKHGETLARRRAQLLTKDHYGVELLEGWAKELGYFAERVVFKQLGADLFEDDKPLWLAEIAALAETAAVDHARAAKAAGATPAPFQGTTGVDFEVHCAGLIRALGWNARVTKGSGDQGVDIVAERDGVRIAFQCKLYSSPVGNAAVQEIAAGRLFEDARFGAVLSNQRYTPGATQLAKATKVALLHPSQLQAYLDWALRRAAARPPLQAVG